MSTNNYVQLRALQVQVKFVHQTNAIAVDYTSKAIGGLVSMIVNHDYQSENSNTMHMMIRDTTIPVLHSHREFVAKQMRYLHESDMSEHTFSAECVLIYKDIHRMCMEIYRGDQVITKYDTVVHLIESLRSSPVGVSPVDHQMAIIKLISQCTDILPTDFYQIYSAVNTAKPDLNDITCWNVWK